MKEVQSSVASHQSDRLRPLPEGWVWKTLPEIVGEKGVFIDGDWVESKDQDPHGDIRLIQLADIGDGYYRNRSDRYLTHEKAIKLGCKFLQDGDLLIARMPDPLGRACIFPGDIKTSVTVVDVCIIRTDNGGENHRWLMHAINSPNIRTQAESLQSGSTRKRISRMNLARIRLPVPPLPDQQRIVARLEELLSDLEAGVAALQRVRAGVKRYKASVLKAAVEGKLVESRGTESGESGLPEGWRWAKLTELGLLGRGKSKHRPRNADFLYGGPYPFVQTGDIRHADGVITKHSQTYSEAGLTQSKLWPKGTLCITIAANITETAILGIEACFPDSIVGFVPNENVEVKFVEFYFRTIKESLERFAPATAQKNINLDVLQKVLIALPPLEEQRRIVAEVERRLESARGVEAAVEAGLKRAARLRQAVLRMAFEGRLL